MADVILDDILSLIHKRETELHAELGKLADVRQTLALDGATTAVAVVSKARRSMSMAQRRAVSRRMKAMWRARRASKR